MSNGAERVVVLTIGCNVGDIDVIDVPRDVGRDNGRVGLNDAVELVVFPTDWRDALAGAQELRRIYIDRHRQVTPCMTFRLKTEDVTYPEKNAVPDIYQTFSDLHKVSK